MKRSADLPRGRRLGSPEQPLQDRHPLALSSGAVAQRRWHWTLNRGGDHLFVSCRSAARCGAHAKQRGWSTVGLTAVGHPKTAVIEGFTRMNYPFTKVVPFNQTIGTAMADEDAEPEMLVLERFLAGADLLVDATAELGIQQLFADLADEAGIPQVYVWGTEGAVGGAGAPRRRRWPSDRSACGSTSMTGRATRSLPSWPPQESGLAARRIR